MSKVPVKKYIYQVEDEKGKICNKRISTRDYVAATMQGEFYFERVDLIGKGIHGLMLKDKHTEKEFPNRTRSIREIAYLEGIEERVLIKSIDDYTPD